jgi:hypothetical protein
MTTPPDFDILIIGSGPSGVQAAVAAVAGGARTAIVDIGQSDDRYHAMIPDQPFEQLRKTDQRQHEYLLGDADTALANLSRAGAHLTPPRQYMIRGMDDLFPMQSDTFAPLQATSAGGLGVSWGSNVFSLEDFELQRIGLPIAEIREQYEKVSGDIGVSAPADDFGDFLAPFKNRQTSPPPDTNASSILRRFKKSESKFHAKGFQLGQAALALLTQDLGERKANKLHDMDFYGDVGWSVYRPLYTLKQLQKSENFTYVPGKLALRFEETLQGVTLIVRNLETQAEQSIKAKRLMLAAGAINSGKLALASQRNFGDRVPILCNTNHWVAAINLAMLGRKADAARHSLAQLAALQVISNDPKDYVLAQFYSYRSLMYFRMLRSIPLPPNQGVTFLRLIATALTCVNLHFSDWPADSKYLQLKSDGARDVFSAFYQHTPEQQRAVEQAERLMLWRLVALRCIPMGIARPAHGASIHYAGTLPVSEAANRFGCRADGVLNGTRSVYVADGSSWKFLPAKGLTFTLMANARRVAGHVLRSLAS